MIGYGVGPVGRAVQKYVGGVGGAVPSWTFISAGPVTTILIGTSLVLPLGTTAQAGDFIVDQVSTAVSQGTPVDAGTTTARYIQAVGGETSVSLTLNVAQIATGIAVVFRPTSAGIRDTSSTITGNPAVVTSLAVSNLPSLITFTGNHNGMDATAWTVSSQPGFVEVAKSPGNAAGTVRAIYFAYKIQTSGATTGNVSLSASPTIVRATVGVFRLT